MDASTKRLLAATVFSLAVLIAWGQLTSRWFPPPPRPPSATAPGMEFADGASTQPAALSATSGPSTGSASQPAGYAAGPGAKPTAFDLGRPASGAAPPTIKSADDYWVELLLTSRGGSIQTAQIVASEYRFSVPRRKTDPPDPYPLLGPFVSPEDGRTLLPFETSSLRLIDEQRDIQLNALDWAGRREEFRDDAGRPASRVVFEASVTHDGKPALLVRKTYSLKRGSFDLDVRLDVENLGDQPLRYVLHQTGPVGLKQDAPQGKDSVSRYEDRFVVAGVSDDGGRIRAAPHQHASIPKDETRSLDLGEKLAWLAHTNKWFVAIIAPQPPPEPGRVAMKLLKASADALTVDAALADDMHLGMKIGPGAPLPPGGVASIDLDVYLGPRDHLRFINDARYAARGYDNILSSTGGSCGFLTFRPLIAVMRWLLSWVHSWLPVPGSFGWAIIVMVLIVRVLLHGITKRGQIGMMRMQKKTAALAPKLEALKARYADDPTALNKETMNLYREAGINPMSQMSSCMLMFIQMPIWIALWTTLNTSIELRHQPFVLWMRDLSGPDALIPFEHGYNIPLIGFMIGPIHSFNLLPIIMGVTMYLQQKLTQKLTRASTPPPSTTPSPDGKPNAADQLRQQQKMMNFMTIFFALMFYNSPCGLNLYIFTSNIFGMLEQWHIRKHIREDEVEGKAPKKKGWLARLLGPFFDNFRRRMEELQKRAEQGRLSPEPPSTVRRPRREQSRKR